MHRHDLAEGAPGKASASDIDEIEPTGLRLDLRLRSHPPQDLLRVGQKREYRSGRRRDVRLAANDEGLLHCLPDGCDGSFRLRRTGAGFRTF